MHWIDCNNDENVHDVVGVQVIIQRAGKPFFRNMHSPDSSPEYRNAILDKKKIVISFCHEKHFRTDSNM